MCEWRGLASLARIGLMVAVVGSVSPRQTRAQDELELRTRLAAARAAQKAAEVARREAARRPAVPVDTTWYAAGPVRVAVMPVPLRDVEAQALVRGIEDGLAMLARRHGDRARALVDSLPWVIVGSSGRFAAFDPLVLMAGHRDVVRRLERPVDAEVVAQAVLAHAGMRLRDAVPSTATFAGDRFSLADDEATFERAGREMAIAWVAPARRCYRGTVADCRRSLSLPDSAARLATWFDATDHRVAVIGAAGDIAPDDQARQGQRRRCYDGDDAACTALAGTLRIRYPFSDNLRASLLREAFRLGDTLMLDRLRTTTGADPIDGLAQAAGITPDSLITSWTRHARAALADTRVSAPALLLCAIGWSMALVALAGARRLG